MSFTLIIWWYPSNDRYDIRRSLVWMCTVAMLGRVEFQQELPMGSRVPQRIHFIVARTDWYNCAVQEPTLSILPVSLSSELEPEDGVRLFSLPLGLGKAGQHDRRIPYVQVPLTGEAQTVRTFHFAALCQFFSCDVQSMTQVPAQSLYTGVLRHLQHTLDRQ
jgi:hypothetical protein